MKNIFLGFRSLFTNRRRFGFVSRTTVASAVVAMSCLAGCNQQDQQAQQLVRKALEQQESGDTQDAIQTLNRSILLDTDLAEAFYLRGSCQAALGNEEFALRDLEQASLLRPEWDRAWWALGTLHRSMNQTDKAIDCLTQSVKLNSKSLDARYDLACTLLKVGKTGEALIHLNTCREHHPDDVNTLIKSASIEINQDPAAAVQTLSQVLKLDRSNGVAWTQRAFAQERNNDLHRALADLTVACRLHPNSSMAWRHRGRLLSKLNRYEEAIQSLQTAADLAPDDHQISQLLQVAQNQAQQQQQATAQQQALAAAESSDQTLPVPTSAAPNPTDPSEFLMFPDDLSDSVADTTPADSVLADSVLADSVPADSVPTDSTGESPAEITVATTEADAASQAPNPVDPSDFLPFPDGSEPPLQVAEVADAIETDDTPFSGFPAFDEFPADSPASTTDQLIASQDTQTEANPLQIPLGALSEVSTATTEHRNELMEVPQEEFPSDAPVFTDIAPQEDLGFIVAEASDTPLLTDAPTLEIPTKEVLGTDSASSHDVAAVGIEEFMSGSSLPTSLTEEQLDTLYYQALTSYRKGDIDSCEAKLATVLQHAPNHKSGLLRMASLLKGKGQLQDAIEHCDQLLSAHGLSTEAVLLKAQIQRQIGQPEAALATYTSLIQSDVPAPKAMNERADLLLDLARNAEAVDDLSSLIESKKYVTKSLERRAKAFEAMQEWNLAIADWTKIGQLDGGNLDALEHRADAFAHMGETSPAIADLENLLRLQPSRAGVVEKLCDLNASLGQWGRVYSLTSRASVGNPPSAELLFLKATASSQLGRTDEAIYSLSEALKRNSHHQPALVRRAELLMIQKNYEASLADWEQALHLHGESASLLTGRAIVLAELGQSERANADLDRAISIEPNHALALQARSQLFRDMSQPAKDMTEGSDVIGLRPVSNQNIAKTATQLFEDGNFKAAAAAFDQALSAGPVDSDFVWKRAQCRIKLNQDELASLDLDQLLKINPRHLGALKERSAIKERAGSYSSAVADLDSVLSQQPHDSDVLLQRGILNHRMAHFNQAVEDFSKALNLEPSLHTAHYRRGLALQQLGDPDRAFSDLEAALKASPNDADYLYSRGNLYASQGVTDKAITDYAQAVEIRPSHAAAWYNYGNMLFPDGRTQEAIECWDKAIEIQPDLFRAYNNRAAAHVQLQHYDAAVADYQMTLKLNPDYAHAYDNYAWLLATAKDSQIRDPQQAIVLAQKACQLSQQRNWAYLNTLAAAYASFGDFDQARQWSVRSHELAPAAEKGRLIRLVKTYESEIQRGTARRSTTKTRSGIQL